MDVTINRDSCIGCGLCTDMCTDVFDLDSENIAVVMQEPADSNHEQCAQGAAEGCPTDAIILQ